MTVSRGGGRCGRRDGERREQQCDERPHVRARRSRRRRSPRPGSATSDRCRRRSCRARSGRSRAARNPPSAASSRRSFACAPARASRRADPDLADRAGRPDRRAAARPRRRRESTAPTTGSWTTTGVTSQRSERSRARPLRTRRRGSPRRRRRRSRPGKARRCRTSSSSEPLEPVGAAPRTGSAPIRAADGIRIAAAAGERQQRPPVRVVDERELAARRGRARGDQVDRCRRRRLLVEPGQRRRVDLHRRPPVDDDATRGACSAKNSRTTNSSVPRADGEPGRGRPVDPAGRSPGRYGREPATSSPGPRRGLRRSPSWTPTNRRRGTSANGRAARAVIARRRGRPRPSPAPAAAHARGTPPRSAAGAPPPGRPPSARRPRATSRCAITGRKRRSMSSGDDELAPVHERSCARAALEREAAAHRRADLDELELARAADELDQPTASAAGRCRPPRPPRRALQLGGTDDRSEPLERMAVQLRRRGSAAPRRASGSRATCA